MRLEMPCRGRSSAGRRHKNDIMPLHPYWEARADR
jgi:hypothetical protein